MTERFDTATTVGPAYLRLECACGQFIVVPLRAGAESREDSWVCPLCEDDFAAEFAAWRRSRNGS